jgi:hypothetical protein
VFTGNKYADLELYLMGLLDSSLVGSERFVLNPAVRTDFNTIIPAADTTLVSITDIINVYGARVPLAGGSPTSFQSLFIGISESPMTSAELSLLEATAAFYASGAEGRDQLIPGNTKVFTPPSFASATKYLGTLSTTVPQPK